jgi:two-component system, chemotaxis family, protein-glutamate methylesterase/glutaminase
MGPGNRSNERPPMSDSARVLIVDDSRIFRAALEEALAGQDGLAVAGSVFNGEKALDFIRATPPDLVTLDVEMPGLGGLETLQAIQRINATRPPDRTIGVIMVSAFTRRGADVTIRALQAGAFDFVTKPNGASAEANVQTLRQQLVPRIRSFLLGRRRRPPESVPAAPRPVSRTSHSVRAVVIAASTGGPQALGAVLPELCAGVDVPIFLVQHMPAEFTRSLADLLARQTCRTAVEARDGEVAAPRTVYVAPGDRHLLLRAGSGRDVLTALNDLPKENGFRPSADVLFRSAAAVLGSEVVAVVLTGMTGDRVGDGTAGLRPLKRAGGYVIAQDEASSVVWGMPGSVVAAGLADAVLPLGQIAGAVRALVAGRGGR